MFRTASGITYGTPRLLLGRAHCRAGALSAFTATELQPTAPAAAFEQFGQTDFDWLDKLPPSQRCQAGTPQKSFASRSES